MMKTGRQVGFFTDDLVFKGALVTFSLGKCGSTALFSGERSEDLRAISRQRSLFF